MGVNYTHKVPTRKLNTGKMYCLGNNPLFNHTSRFLRRISLSFSNSNPSFVFSISYKLEKRGQSCPLKKLGSSSSAMFSSFLNLRLSNCDRICKLISLSSLEFLIKFLERASARPWSASWLNFSYFLYWWNLLRRRMLEGLSMTD